MRKSRNNESREYESRDHEENKGRSFYNNDYVEYWKYLNL